MAATEGGVQDIISTRSKIYEKLGIDFNELTLKQMIVLFKEYPSLLRRPIFDSIEKNFKKVLDK
ncbi:hypothetical protein EfmAA610_04290 [Enterococcus faecium]|nr:hypothetical protein EfmAA610_04290 [Enterococcus faecium]